MREETETVHPPSAACVSESVLVLDALVACVVNIARDLEYGSFNALLNADKRS